MTKHILENEVLRVTVADAGAELVSVYDKSRKLERIWTGNPEVWNRHAPVLFPFVGKVAGGRYRIGGQEYTMKTQHGFARDRNFTCLSASAQEVVHRLCADEQTLAIYPYSFCLTIRHRLDGRHLQVEWTVENDGKERMYYSIGGHPGFLLPPGIRKEDCFLLFPEADTLRYISADPAGFALTGNVRTLKLVDGRIPYGKDIPDTWIFEDGQVRRVGIATPDGSPYVRMDCAQFPMLAVWANPAGPFICLEPWFGRTDDEGFEGSIDQKKDIQMLEPGERREISYSMEFC